jgi:predicted nuclease of predicted toxin-antitoxin system
MKLLFEHNLSYKLVARLVDVFPESVHVRNVNLHEADDQTVWEYARANGFAIVSKDEDFHLAAPSYSLTEFRCQPGGCLLDGRYQARLILR